ncbi:hypothetical protein AAMO2058_001208300 [Amorphochlora amoebiformis]
MVPYTRMGPRDRRARCSGEATVMVMAMAVLMAVIMTTALGFGPIVNSTSLSGVATAVRRAPTGRVGVSLGHGRVSRLLKSRALELEKEMGSNSRLSIKVTVPAGDVNKCIKRSIKAIEKVHTIPGFRKGKPVPRTLLDQYVPKKDLHAQMVSDILNSTMPKALQSVRSSAIDGSEELETSFEDLVANFNEKGDLQYVIGVDLPPEIQWKQPYKGLEIEISSFNTPEKKQKMVEKAILMTRKKKAQLENASERELRKGDIAMISYMARDKATGEVLVDLGGQRPKEFDTDDDTNLPGFIENLFGTNVEEIKEFDLTFPPHFIPEKYRGTTATFKAMVHQIFEPSLPPEDDQLAGEIVPDAKNMDEARTFLTEAVSKEVVIKDNDLVEDSIVQKIGDIADCPLPEVLIQENGQQMYGGMLMELQQSGKIAPNVLNSLMSPELVAKYISDNRPEIEHRVRTVLAFDAIQKEQNIEITNEMIDKEASAMIESFGEMGVDYDQDTVREQAEELITSKAIIGFLKENAIVTLK